MVDMRAAKVAKVADFIPEQTVVGPSEGDLLVVGWGGTFGHLYTAVVQMQAEGKNLSLAHFSYINPLPRNTKAIFENFKRIIVCELNSGQFANYLRMQYPHFIFEQYNKVQGLPFTVIELTDKFNSLITK
jgi:2-oxoglutarate ferredoxin oxidoreductase subunit alpha